MRRAPGAREPSRQPRRPRALSRAQIFSGEEVPVLVRISNAPGKPTSHDATRAGRGLAVKLRPNGPGGGRNRHPRHHHAGLPRPQRRGLPRAPGGPRPDPETGEPDMEKLGAYLGAHPEAQTSIQQTLGSEPPASFATSPSTHRTPSSSSMPTATAPGSATAGARGRRAAHLRRRGPRARPRLPAVEELGERLAEGPFGFTLLFQLAADGDRDRGSDRAVARRAPARRRPAASS